MWKRATGGGSGLQVYNNYYAAKADIPSDKKIVTGFKPKYISMTGKYSSNNMSMYYDENVSTTQITRYFSGTRATYNITPTETNATLASIDNDGFTLNTAAYNGLTLLTVYAFG